MTVGVEGGREVSGLFGFGFYRQRCGVLEGMQWSYVDFRFGSDGMSRTLSGGHCADFWFGFDRRRSRFFLQLTVQRAGAVLGYMNYEPVNFRESLNHQINQLELAVFSLFCFETNLVASIAVVVVLPLQLAKRSTAARLWPIQRLASHVSGRMHIVAILWRF